MRESTAMHSLNSPFYTQLYSNTHNRKAYALIQIKHIITKIIRDALNLRALMRTHSHTYLPTYGAEGHNVVDKDKDNSHTKQYIQHSFCTSLVQRNKCPTHHCIGTPHTGRTTSWPHTHTLPLARDTNIFCRTNRKIHLRQLDEDDAAHFPVNGKQMERARRWCQEMAAAEMQDARDDTTRDPNGTGVHFLVVAQATTIKTQITKFSVSGKFGNPSSHRFELNHTPENETTDTNKKPTPKIQLSRRPQLAGLA